MIDIALGIFAGLGLFFIGMRLLSTHLKEATSERVRVIASKLAKRRLVMMGLGAVAGAVTQSTNAVTAVATGLATAQIVGLREAFPLIACANIGTSVLVFLAAVSLHDLALAATALCGLLFFLGIDQIRAYRVATGTFLSVVMIVLGLDLVAGSARDLRELETIHEIVGWVAGHPIAAFAVGAALVPAVQTAKTVAAIVAVLAHSGVLGPVEAVAAVIGANMTSAMNVAFLTARISLVGRALAFYQALLKVVGSSAAILVLAVFGTSFLELSVAADPKSAAVTVAVAYLLMQIAAYAVALAFEPAIERRLTRVVENAAIGDISRPRYISREALRDPGTATELSFREHLDIVAHLPDGLDEVREQRTKDERGGPRRDHPAIARLLQEFLDALAREATDGGVQRRTGSLQRLNGLVLDLQEQIGRLGRGAALQGQHPAVAERIAATVESAHFVLSVFAAWCRSSDPVDRRHLAELTGDRTDLMEKNRLAVMSELHADVASEQNLFEASLDFERMIWLLRRYLLVGDEPESPYRQRAVEA